MIQGRPYVDFLISTGLSPTQFLLCYLVYKGYKDEIRLYKEAYPTEDGTMIGAILTDDLYNKGWIRRDGNYIEVTEKFKKHFVKNYYALRELMDAYPAFMEIKGANVPLLTIDTDRYELIYGRKICHSYAEHQEVLKDVEWGVKHKYIRFGIEKFIEGELWLPIRKLRLENDAQIPMEFDIDQDF